MVSAVASNVARAVAGRPRVVVVGTGWAGFRFVRSLDRRHFDVVVVSPRDHFIFTPLLAVRGLDTVAEHSVKFI